MAVIHVTDRDGNQHSVEAREGAVLMEVLRDEGMGIEAICGGQCACGTCHCYIDPAWFEKLGGCSEDEHQLVSYLHCFDSKRSRLTCQIEVTKALDGLRLEVAPDE